MKPLYLFLCILSLLTITFLSLPYILHTYSKARLREARHVTYQAHVNPDFAQDLMTKKVNEPFQVEGDLNLLNGKSVFCFALYGQREQYKKGTDRLIESIHNSFPRWYAVLFLEEESPWIEHYEYLKTQYAHLIVYPVRDKVEKGSATGMFWRFLPLTVTPHRMFVVDVDDPLDVKQLITLFTVWDHSDYTFARFLQTNPLPWPKEHIQGGYWGMKGIDPPLFDLKDLTDIKNRTPYGVDEIWLRYYLRDSIKEKGIVTGYPSQKSRALYRLSYGDTWQKQSYVFTPVSTQKDLEDITPDSFWKKHVV